MDVSDYHYKLPPALIARYPLPTRSASRLLCLHRRSGVLTDSHVVEIPHYLAPGDLLVFNNTKVIPARIYGKKESGGKVELLIERVQANNQLITHIRASKAPQIGSKILLEGQQWARVIGRHGALYQLEMAIDLDIAEWMEAVGEIPLPPYLGREAEASDKERYQTVFAEYPGAVAAPTAGLHFDPTLLRELISKGVQCGFLTLHVGAGTFAPLRSEQILSGKLHAEHIEVSQSLCDQIMETKKRGNKVIAVGTTTVRALETVAAQSVREGSLASSILLTPAGSEAEIRPYQGETEIFITPGFTFRIIDAMITNFHLPESSLLMLVSAFAGYENTMAAYQHAVAQEYRFFSYGDAMLIDEFGYSESV